MRATILSIFGSFLFPLLTFSFQLFSLVHAQAAAPLPIDWSQAQDVNLAAKQMGFRSTHEKIDGQPTLRLTATPIKGAKQSGITSCVAFTRIPVAPANLETISFEYQGDGSANFGSAFIGSDPNLLTGYEVQFPLNSTQWRRVTYRRSDFINNALPWEKTARLAAADLSIPPNRINHVGFGRSNCNYKFFTPKFTFAIRGLELSNIAGPAPERPAFSPGLKHTLDCIAQRKPLKILLLGDSITDFGGKQSYGWHCARLLEKQFNLPPCQVANAGVAGHSVRAGTIVLPRSLRLMPDPDLVCILFGANDCKAATGEFNQSGFTEEVFAANLVMLIEQVRLATHGKADIILLSGVPRLNKKGGTSNGNVEKIVAGIRKAANTTESAYCDTFATYRALPAATHNKFYLDTIHQNQAGLAFIGQQLFKTIDAAVPAASH